MIKRIDERSAPWQHTLDDIRTWPAAVESLPRPARSASAGPTAYELARRGELPCTVLKVGSRYRVVTSSLLAHLDGQAPAT